MVGIESIGINGLGAIINVQLLIANVHACFKIDFIIGCENKD